MDRRTLLKGSATLGAAGAFGAGMTAPAAAKGGDFKDDIDVLNYALVLEYLLSELYRQAIPQLAGKDERYIRSISSDEDGHIAAITQTIQSLGGDPVRTPSLDLGDVLSTRKRFLQTSNKLENLFAGAYLYAAGFVENPDILQAAAGIYGVEERHAAITGQLLGLATEPGIYTGAFGKPASKTKVLAEVEPFFKGAKAGARGAAVTL